MITAAGFGMGALVNFEWKLDKELGMIVRQSRGYFWMVKRLSDGRTYSSPSGIWKCSVQPGQRLFKT